MPSRICPDCAQAGRPAIHNGPDLYCASCKHAKDKARGSRQQRGYDARHDQARAAALAAFVPGQPCALGGEPLRDASKVDLAHNAARTGWAGLACWSHNRGHVTP